jgi:hypothetical protein
MRRVFGDRVRHLFRRQRAVSRPDHSRGTHKRRRRHNDIASLPNAESERDQAPIAPKPAAD